MDKNQIGWAAAGVGAATAVAVDARRRQLHRAQLTPFDKNLRADVETQQWFAPTRDGGRLSLSQAVIPLDPRWRCPTATPGVSRFGHR